MYHLPRPESFAAWRDVARQMASHGVSPADIDWSETPTLLSEAPPEGTGPVALRVPSAFLRLAELVLAHVDPEAPALAYAMLVALQTSPGKLSNPADPLTRRLEALAKGVRRDLHKMHAFVRFKEMESEGPRRRFGAWFEPDHRILRLGAPFFAKRFGDMDWMIATPEGVARFDDRVLTFHPPVPRPDLPDDASEALWGTYFANIFNPARVKISAMRSEMPLKYWKNLPETRLIPDMLAQADTRVRQMRDAAPTQAPAHVARIKAPAAIDPPMGQPDTVAEAAAQAASCSRCDLCHAATQTVWGAGDAGHGLMLVGEQPGDREDLAGAPFVGPAGQLLREILDDVDAPDTYMTNAVKHFRFRSSGRKRIHMSPSRGHVEACRWWLDQERRLLAPKITVALGATAALALTGNGQALTPRRGQIEAARDGGPVLITWHPSSILRLPPPEAAVRRGELRADLITAMARLRDMRSGSALL